MRNQSTTLEGLIVIYIDVINKTAVTYLLIFQFSIPIQYYIILITLIFMNIMVLIILEGN